MIDPQNSNDGEVTQPDDEAPPFLQGASLARTSRRCAASVSYRFCRWPDSPTTR
jgi:hypothetical protein